MLKAMINAVKLKSIPPGNFIESHYNCVCMHSGDCDLEDGMLSQCLELFVLFYSAVMQFTLELRHVIEGIRPLKGALE